MIEETTLRDEIVSMLHEGEFLVSVSVRPSLHVEVVLDAMGGLPISRCIEVSRAIEQLHDRDVEDYALEVSSPNLGDPWRVYLQYIKHLQAPIQVVTTSGIKWQGVLLEVGPEGESGTPEFIVVEVQRLVAPSEGSRKKKILVTESLRFDSIDLKRISYDLDKL